MTEQLKIDPIIEFLGISTKALKALYFLRAKWLALEEIPYRSRYAKDRYLIMLKIAYELAYIDDDEREANIKAAPAFAALSDKANPN